MDATELALWLNAKFGLNDGKGERVDSLLPSDYPFKSHHNYVNGVALRENVRANRAVDNRTYVNNNNNAQDEEDRVESKGNINPCCDSASTEGDSVCTSNSSSHSSSRLVVDPEDRLNIIINKCYDMHNYGHHPEQPEPEQSLPLPQETETLVNAHKGGGQSQYYANHHPFISMGNVAS